MQTETKTETKTEQPRPNDHVSADDLKKIRGGIAAPGHQPAKRSAVEKSDEDFPARMTPA